MKVLGTTASLNQDMLRAMEAFGFKSAHNQYRIICKCKSLAEANRKCAAIGLGQKVFRSDWCSETGNVTELEICEQTDIAFSTINYGKRYFTIEEIQKWIEENPKE